MTSQILIFHSHTGVRVHLWPTSRLRQWATHPQFHPPAIAGGGTIDITRGFSPTHSLFGWIEHT